MSSTGTLGGVTMTRCRVQLPHDGVWWADVELSEPTSVTGAQTLILADLSLSCTVMSGGPWQGRAQYRVAGGAGGWGRVLPAKDYTSDAGVVAAKVLGDVASECGETLQGIPDQTLGIRWTRDEAPASYSLSRLYPAGWYVGEDGVTRIGSRPSVEYAGAASRLDKDFDSGKWSLASDTLAGLTPGAVIDGTTVVDVEHSLEVGILRTTVWTDTRSTTSRRIAAMRRLFGAMAVGSRFRGTWEYRVVSQMGERLNLQAVRSVNGLPDLRRVKVRLAPGVRADWKLGSFCLVTFVDGDPARATVVAGDDPESPGFQPTELDLCAAAGAVVREGDTISLTDGSTGQVTITVGIDGHISKVLA